MVIFQDELGHRTAYALWGDSFLYLYSITDRNSFEIISALKQNIESSQRNSSSVGIIVGNKNDLLEGRSVAYEEACSLAEKLQLPFCEISVKDGDQMEKVAEIFRVLFRFWKQDKQTKKNCTGNEVSEEQKEIIEPKEIDLACNNEYSADKDSKTITKESVTSPMKKMKLILFQKFTRPRLPSL